MSEILNHDGRTGCPINLTLEVLGDRWSLIVVRDIMVGNRRHFRDLLTRSEEGIASNILASRLKRLTDLGLITRIDDPSHAQKAIYSLTEPAIGLVPVFAAIGSWGRRHLRVTKPMAVRAELIERGGPDLWAAFMEELRQVHIVDPVGGAAGRVPTPLRDALTAAYDAAVAEEQAGAAA